MTNTDLSAIWPAPPVSRLRELNPRCPECCSIIVFRMEYKGEIEFPGHFYAAKDSRSRHLCLQFENL